MLAYLKLPIYSHGDINMLAKHTALTVIVGVGLAWVVWKAHAAIWTPLQTLGLVLFVAGFILWTVARFQLGASFSVTAQARQLVTRGLYSKIRSPIYVFGSCVMAGIFLLIGHPVLLLIFLVVIPMQIWRARKEAAVLEGKFGDQYRVYRASTWF